MSFIALPVTAIPKDSLEWAIVGGGGLLTPLVGGVEQFAARMGDKFAVGGVLGTMEATCAKAWIAALLAQRRGTPVRWTLPSPYGMTAGTPLVKGAAQTGSTLDIDGVTAGLTIPAGTPFNIHDGSGRPYLHFTSQAVTANGSGEATLTFTPMMRVSPADNSAVEFASPKLEGWMNEVGVSWSLRRLRFHTVPFSIREAR